MLAKNVFKQIENLCEIGIFLLNSSDLKFSEFLEDYYFIKNRLVEISERIRNIV